MTVHVYFTRSAALRQTDIRFKTEDTMYYVFVAVVVIVVVVAPLGPTRLIHCVRYDDMYPCPYNMSICNIVYTSLLSAVIIIDQSKMPILRSCLRQEPEQNHKGYSYCKDVRINTITIIPLQVISLRV